MPCFTVPIHEYNHCHAPEDGRFCGGGSGVVGVASVGWSPGTRAPHEWFSFSDRGDWHAKVVRQIPMRDLKGIEHMGLDGEDYLRGLLKDAANPPAGHELVVRIGGTSGKLSGRNAANLPGLITFIGSAADTPGFWDKTLTVYHVQMKRGVFGSYKRLNDQHKRDRGERAEAKRGLFHRRGDPDVMSFTRSLLQPRPVRRRT